MALSAGLAGIEWSATGHAPPGALKRAAEIRSMCQGEAIRVVSYGSYFYAGTGKDFLPTLATALALNAPLIRVWAGPRGVSPDQASAEAWTRCVKDLQLACDAAAEHNIAIGLEFHRLTLTEGDESTLRLLADAGRKNLRTYWQPLPGVTAEIAKRQLRALTPHLAHLHVFQWDEDLQRHPLFKGEAFWIDVLRTQVSASARECWALLEFLPGDDPCLLATEARALKVWLEQIDGSRSSRAAILPT
ncbi:sugar phosphate isomerase/epimerase family protein [Rhizobacter sp. Root404]|uniref:sugar phosphate isomerase/epimerase family protein n=1 Tax=Rhizobacter sp. Root404 TaxID=1736528 RepID=UPI003527EEC4